MRVLVLSWWCLVPALVSGQPHSERVVAKDSPVMRELRAQPEPRDLKDLLVVREKFRIAGEPHAAKAIDAHLAHGGLLALHGLERPAGRSIAELLAGPPPDAQPALVSSILDGWLTPRASAERPAIVRNGILEVPLEIVNTGRATITQFDARLQIEGVRHELGCRAQPWFDQMEPGEVRAHACHLHGTVEELQQAARLAHAAFEDPARLRLRPVRINFEQPAVNFGSRGIYHWLRGNEASQQAERELRQAGCQARGTCLQLGLGLASEVLQFVIAPLAGLMLGFAIGRLAKRPGTWGLGLTLLAPALFAAGLVILFTSAAATQALLGLVLSATGVVALLVFIPAVWIGIYVGRRRRAAPT